MLKKFFKKIITFYKFETIYVLVTCHVYMGRSSGPIERIQCALPTGNSRARLGRIDHSSSVTRSGRHKSGNL